MFILSFIVLDLRPSQLIPDLTLIRWIREHPVFDKENLKQARIWKYIETLSNCITCSMATETQTTIQAQTNEEIMLVTKTLKKLKSKSKIWGQDFLIRRKFRFLFQESWQFFQGCPSQSLKKLKSNQSKSETHLRLKLIRLHQKSNISTRNLIRDLTTTISRQKNVLKRLLTFIM